MCAGPTRSVFWWRVVYVVQLIGRSLRKKKGNGVDKAIAVLRAGVLLLVLSTAACAPVGSEGWCENMREKAKGDWTANETVDFAKHCVF